MAGYTRQSSLNNGDTITAALFNNEYNQLLAAFNATSGHKHDGTAAEGPVIALIGDAGLATPLNKIQIDTTNDEIGFHIDVSGTSTEQFKLLDGAIVPITTNDIDLGTSSLQFKDAFFDGTVTLDGLTIGSATSITDVDTDLTSVSGSDDTVASAKAIKTYVDAQVTASDLDFSGDTGGSQSIDLDSQSLTLTGGTGIDTTGSAQTMTFAIDNTVATLTGSQTLTNKVIDLDNNTLSNIEVDNLKSGVLDTDITSVSGSDDTLASAKAIKTYVDAQVATIPVGDITSVVAGDGLTGGGTSGDVTLNVVGGTGIDANANNIAIDSTVATLTGSQNLTNKTLTSPVLNTGISGTAFKDEDNMSSNSATSVASQQSIKAYVDTQVATIPTGDTTGTLDNDNGASLQLNFWLAAGSDRSSGTLSTTWTSVTNANRAVGQVNHADNTSNEFYITGVQLEAGQVASDFEFLPVDVNLKRCQRYYQKIVSGNSELVGYGYFQTASSLLIGIPFQTTMRTDPTLEATIESTLTVDRNGGNETITSLSVNRTSTNNADLYNNSVSSTQGVGAKVRTDSSGDSIAFVAEL